MFPISGQYNHFFNFKTCCCVPSLVSFRTVVVWDFSFPPIPEYFLYPVVIKREVSGK